MKNLEQIRAAHALAFFKDTKHPEEFSGKNGGDILSKLPSLIVSSGLLSAAAFAVAKGEGFLTCMQNIFAHLVSPEVGAFSGGTDFDTQLSKLAETDALVLRRATTEAIAYANYLKRFKPKSKQDTDKTED